MTLARSDLTADGFGNKSRLSSLVVYLLHRDRLPGDMVCPQLFIVTPPVIANNSVGGTEYITC